MATFELVTCPSCGAESGPPLEVKSAGRVTKLRFICPNPACLNIWNQAVGDADGDGPDLRAAWRALTLRLLSDLDHERDELALQVVALLERQERVDAEHRALTAALRAAGLE